MVQQILKILGWITLVVGEIASVIMAKGVSTVSVNFVYSKSTEMDWGVFWTVFFTYSFFVIVGGMLLLAFSEVLEHLSIISNNVYALNNKDEVEIRQEFSNTNSLFKDWECKDCKTGNRYENQKCCQCGAERY